MVAWVLPLHENEGQDKRVESVWFPCADEGSTPSSSTSLRLKKGCPYGAEILQIYSNLTKFFLGPAEIAEIAEILFALQISPIA